MPGFRKLYIGICGAAAIAMTTPLSVLASSDLKQIFVDGLPDEVPGALVYVARDGKTLLHEAHGFANLSLMAPMKPDYYADIGSIAKQFTAVSILKLQQEGKLNIDQPVQTYIPEFPVKAHPVTLRHLLTHTSGIPNFVAIDGWFEQAEGPTNWEELRAYYAELPLEFEPGSRWAYSNSGFSLLAEIVERVSGMPFPDYLTNQVLEPAGITDIIPLTLSEVIPGRIEGYVPSGNTLRPAEQFHPTQAWGAGSMLARLPAIDQWHQALANGDIIEPELLKQAWQPITLNSGRPTSAALGWEVEQVQGEISVEHGGYSPGVFSYSIWLPESEVTVAISVNTKAFNPTELAVKLAAAAAGKPYPAPEEVPVTDAIIERYLGTWTDEKNVPRTIMTLNNKLFVKRGHGAASEVYPAANGHLYYRNSMSYLALEEGEQGMRLKLQTRGGLAAVAERTSEEAPRYASKDLSPEQLAEYSGFYRLSPEFGFKVFTDQGDLFLQGTGQHPGELLVIDDNYLITADLIASFVIQRDAQNKITGLVLQQAGKEYPATLE